MQEHAPDGDPGLARVVLITAPDLPSARELGRALVEARAAACANLVPGLTSIFRWQGKVQEEAEVLVIVKTRADRLEELGRLVAQLHPYEVPELVALRPEAVAPAYLAWLLSESAP